MKIRPIWDWKTFPKLFGYIDSKKYWEERKEINDIRLTLINNYNLVDVSVEQIKERSLKSIWNIPNCILLKLDWWMKLMNLMMNVKESVEIVYLV